MVHTLRKNSLFYENHFAGLRNYVKIDLSGDNCSDKQKIDVLAKAISEMTINRDTIHGLYVHLSDSTKCQNLVSLWDVCINSKADKFEWDVDDFWIVPVLNKRSVKLQEAPQTVMMCR